MKNENVRSAFDFTYWSKLAKENPQEFEKQRMAVIEHYLANIKRPETEQRLRRLQWRVDIERQRARTPTDAATRIYDMMWESVGKNLDAIRSLADSLTGVKTGVSAQSAGRRGRRLATILPFKNRDASQSIDA